RIDGFLHAARPGRRTVSPKACPPSQGGGAEMRVHIIPEDYPNDHLILRPIFGAMFAYLDKPYVRIDIHSPEVKGWEAVKNLGHIREIIAEFPITHLFLLCVDRDGDSHRRKALDDLESRVQRILLSKIAEVGQ